MVVELPPGPFILIIMDHNEHWILDLGLPGLDAGRGGKHLIVPPGYQDKVPKGYCVGRSVTLRFSSRFEHCPTKATFKEPWRVCGGSRSIRSPRPRRQPC